MKTVRNTITMLLALLILVSIPITAFALDFTDVSGLNAEYRNAINWVSDNGIMLGTGVGVFAPETILNRAMYVTLLYSYAGKPEIGNVTNPFVDVPNDKYYTNAVLWAYSNGVVAGTSPTTFSPNNPITYQQLFTILYAFTVQYQGYTPYNLYPTNDDTLALAEIPYFSSVGNFAKTPVKWAVSNGIVKTSSITSGSFYSSGVPRKDVALTMTRYNTNVDMLIPHKSTLSFCNYAGFLSHIYSANRYYANYAHRELLGSRAQNIPSYILKSKFNNSYRGSCYGMCLAIILDMTGRIDFNKGYGKDTDNMFDLRAPSLVNSDKNYPTTDYISSTKITTSESAFHYLQTIQEDISQQNYNTYGGIIFVDGTNAYSKTSQLLDKMKHSGLALFSFILTDGNSNTGHTVILMGPPRNAPLIQNVYYFTVYDPDQTYTSYPFNTLTILNTTSVTAFSIDTAPAGQITSISYITDFSVFDNYDLDGVFNVNPQ